MATREVRPRCLCYREVVKQAESDASDKWQHSRLDFDVDRINVLAGIRTHNMLAAMAMVILWLPDQTRGLQLHVEEGGHRGYQAAAG